MNSGPEGIQVIEANLRRKILHRRRVQRPRQLCAFRQQALEIYEADYWHGPRFDQVSVVSPVIAAELCDTGVNMGPSVQVKWFQRWLNVFNIQQQLYPDLLADGQIGPRTISALKSFLVRRGSEGETVLLRALNCSQGQRYLELAEQRPANESFVYGWMRERVGL